MKSEDVKKDVFRPGNLMAWCIVPFDAKKRGPEERAAMLERLGIRKLAYDYRQEHIPTFDAEVLAMKKRGIELTAWWFPGGLNEEARTILAVIDRHGIKPQLWVMGGGGNPANEAEQAALVEREAARFKPLAEEAARRGLKLALYNHGGWFGEPENQLAIIERLRRDQITNVGIVYNFHHGHGHLARFPGLWKKMQPHLLAVNLNGMTIEGDKHGRKILTLGEGTEELDMMRVIRDSGWQGPVGIIDHREETDSEETLRQNLRGLEWLRRELAVPGSGGAKPRPSRPAVVLAPGRFGRALDARAGGVVLPAPSGSQTWPVTIEAWVTLERADGFNIIAAQEPKSSAAHWELYTYAGTGDVSLFLPGRGGEYRSGVAICDDRWHHVAAVLEAERLRLYVDGRLAKEAALPALQGASRQGAFAIGRLVEGGIGCRGLIDDVRLSRGVLLPEALPAAAAARLDSTLGLWAFDDSGEFEAFGAGADFDRAPLIPAEHPWHRHPINRDRIYDFYAKQARWAMAQEQKPTFLPPFPGLDGGQQGHWGNQNEETWASDRWNTMDLGSAQAGVFRGWGLTVPRGVVVDLGGPARLAACFDPGTLRWVAAWRGGFLRFDSYRHGFLGGCHPAGERVEIPEEAPAAAGTFTYHGFYRHEDRVIFHYTRDGVEWIDTAWAEGERWVREKAPAAEASAALAALLRPGAAQWPQVLETRGTLGEAAPGSPYAVDTVTLPVTPWRSLWHFGDHDFFPNGDAAVCTIEGEVWLVRGLDDTLEKVTWKRFAAGLHHALGLKIADGKIHVLGRDQITRLEDRNGDDEADYYACFSNAYRSSPAGHDFITGLQRDAEGRFYFASSTQGVCRTSADGREVEVLATGFRNPDGLGLGPRGEILVAVQEGEWTPASMVMEITPGGHYGYQGPKPGPLGHLPPLVYLPRAVDNSCGGQAFVEGGRWGVPEGTPLHFSFGLGSVMLIVRDRHFSHQAGVVGLPGEFASGAHRGRFHPRDGQLWVSGTAGWGTYAPAEGSWQRLRYTGVVTPILLGYEARDNGVLLHFSEPLPAQATEADRWFAQSWNYRYGPAYGSDEFSARQPGRAGHDVLEITSVHALSEGRTLFLEIPQLHPAHTLHLFGEGLPRLAREAFLTIHELGEAFTDFPGYRAVAKMPLPPSDEAVFAPPPPAPVSWEKGSPGRALLVRATTGLLFEQKELHARAGEALSLTFDNPDVMPHNWVLGAPGSLARLTELANKLITDPDAVSRHYVPASPEVLVHTRLLEPASSTTIHFTAPAVPGDYPYLCTFPGHAMIMRGVLKIE